MWRRQRQQCFENAPCAGRHWRERLTSGIYSAAPREVKCKQCVCADSDPWISQHLSLNTGSKEPRAALPPHPREPKSLRVWDLLKLLTFPVPRSHHKSLKPQPNCQNMKQPLTPKQIYISAFSQGTIYTSLLWQLKQLISFIKTIMGPFIT